MSGYKHATVTISMDEYRRLQGAEMKKRFKELSQNSSPSLSNDDVVLNLIQQLEDRERQLQSVMASMGQTSNRYDDELLQNILQQNASCYENLVSTLRSSSIGLQDLFTAITDNLIQSMQSEHEQINQSLHAVIVEQSAYQSNENAKAEAAQQWLQGCFTLVEFITNQFEHERFMPGRLNRVLRNLNLAENNFVSGFSESCLQMTQQMYLELTDMNIELEQLVLQWQSLFQVAYSAINELIYQMVSNGNVNAIGLQGEELPNWVDLNYWTNGRFSQVLGHTRQLSADFIQDQSILTVEDIDRVYSQIIPVIRESFESIVYEARIAALNSQLRMNIAEKALQALENHGFSLDNAGYSNNDMRSQFNAHLECPDGSEVTIEVSPSGPATNDLSNELVMITSHPYLKTEHEARMHWDELSETLTQYHLSVTPPEVLSPPNTIGSKQNGKQSQVGQQITQVER